MGLETVELVMAIEDEFQIDIPNEDALHLITVGDIYLYLIAKLNVQPDDQPQIWEKLKLILIKQLGVKPEQVTKEAAIVQDLSVD